MGGSPSRGLLRSPEAHLAPRLKGGPSQPCNSRALWGQEGSLHHFQATFRPRLTTPEGSARRVRDPGRRWGHTTSYCSTWGRGVLGATTAGERSQPAAGRGAASCAGRPFPARRRGVRHQRQQDPHPGQVRWTLPLASPSRSPQAWAGGLPTLHSLPQLPGQRPTSLAPTDGRAGHSHPKTLSFLFHKRVCLCGHDLVNLRNSRPRGPPALPAPSCSLGCLQRGAGTTQDPSPGGSGSRGGGRASSSPGLPPAGAGPRQPPLSSKSPQPPLPAGQGPREDSFGPSPRHWSPQFPL